MGVSRVTVMNNNRATMKCTADVLFALQQLSFLSVLAIRS